MFYWLKNVVCTLKRTAESSCFVVGNVYGINLNRIAKEERESWWLLSNVVGLEALAYNIVYLHQC